MMGTSDFAREFPSGTPLPTAEESVQQFAGQELRALLDRGGMTGTVSPEADPLGLSLHYFTGHIFKDWTARDTVPVDAVYRHFTSLYPVGGHPQWSQERFAEHLATYLQALGLFTRITVAEGDTPRVDAFTGAMVALTPDTGRRRQMVSILENFMPLPQDPSPGSGR